MFVVSKEMRGMNGLAGLGIESCLEVATANGHNFDKTRDIRQVDDVCLSEFEQYGVCLRDRLLQQQQK